MRNICFEMPDSHGEIVEPGFDPIDRRADMAQMLKDDIVRVVAHNLSICLRTPVMGVSTPCAPSRFGKIEPDFHPFQAAFETVDAPGDGGVIGLERAQTLLHLA